MEAILLHSFISHRCFSVAYRCSLYRYRKVRVSLGRGNSVQNVIGAILMLLLYFLSSEEVTFIVGMMCKMLRKMLRSSSFASCLSSHLYTKSQVVQEDVTVQDDTLTIMGTTSLTQVRVNVIDTLPSHCEYVQRV